MSHLHGGAVCPHSTKAVCDKAIREALGKCTVMTQAKEPTQCRLWASSRVDGRPMCLTHAGAVLERNIALAAKAARMARLQLEVDKYMAWTTTHPSVWQEMPR